MDYSFVPMDQEFASTIVGEWKYENEYSIYDYANEADHMLDQTGWGSGIFAVLDQAGDLVGELSIEFFDEQGQPCEYSDFTNEALINQCELWIGFGLRPDRIGKGHGAGFVAACVDYAIQKYPYRGEFIRLGVAKFNQRAIKAYERAGFREYESLSGEIGGQTMECISMRKRIT